MKITADNYELYLFQYAEGMLSDKERREVEAFLDAHPDIREEFALYDPTLNVAELPKMEYPDKAKLKHYTLLSWKVLRYAAAVLLLAGVATFFMLRNNSSAPDRQTIVAQNQTDTTAPQPLQDTTQNAETPKQQLPTPTPVRHTAQHANNQQIATNTTPVSESDYKNETTQPSPLLAENTDSTTMQDNDSQNFIQYIETPTKVVYTDQIITYSQYVAVMDEDDSVPESSRLENFVINLGPVQAYMEIRNGIAYLKDRIGESDGNMLITLFSTKQPKE